MALVARLHVSRSVTTIEAFEAQTELAEVK
jgi:hypothetical protein